MSSILCPNSDSPDKDIGTRSLQRTEAELPLTMMVSAYPNKVLSPGVCEDCFSLSPLSLARMYAGPAGQPERRALATFSFSNKHSDKFDTKWDVGGSGGLL
jgi:hypothetical protein